MRTYKRGCFSSAIALFVLSAMPVCHAYQLVLEDAAGSTYTWHIDPEIRFKDLISEIQTTYATIERENTDMEIGSAFKKGLHFFVSDYGTAVQTSKTTNSPVRSYYADISDFEDSIHYIVKTLGCETLITIGLKESTLKKHGKRIEVVHPLLFLTSVFTNEELKVAMGKLEGKAWVWKSFLDGLVESLIKENSEDNLMQYVDHFAQKVQIDPKLIKPLLEKGRWKEFISVLISEVPRKVNTKQRNM